MPAVVNRHGLSRTIPDPVERLVRQRDGFGCVICGNAFIDYDHLNPPFVDATEHNPDGIVTLCIQHHGMKTRGTLSNETIERHKLNPACLRTGFSFGPLDLGFTHPEVQIGRLKCTNVSCLIQIDGVSVLNIDPPPSPGLPFLLSAQLRDPDGNLILQIEDNVWRTPTDNWDVDTTGANVTIRRGRGDIVLRFRSEPPHRLVIERIKMHHLGYEISCREGENLQIITSSGSILSASELILDGCRAAIVLNRGAISLGVDGGSMMMSAGFSSRPQTYPRSLGFTGSAMTEKPGRNSRCSCGSGKKFKHCHGKFI